MLGRVRTALREPDSAIVAYRAALSLDPEDVWSMNNLGLVLIRAERYEEALPPLARAVELRPTAPVFRNNLGMALEHVGQYAAAREAYRGALAADSTYGKAALSLARLEAVADAPGTVPVDLTTLAGQFARELRPAPVVSTEVRTDTLPVTTAVSPDSVRPPRR